MKKRFDIYIPKIKFSVEGTWRGEQTVEWGVGQMKKEALNYNGVFPFYAFTQLNYVEPRIINLKQNEITEKEKTNI